MNPKCYFESDPWKQALEICQKSSFGKITAVSIQCVCPTGEITVTGDLWERRLSDLLGAAESKDVLNKERVRLILSRHKAGAIARISIDEAPAGTVENFEIVGENTLVVWKPDVHAIALIHAENYFVSEYLHEYADSLVVS